MTGTMCVSNQAIDLLGKKILYNKTKYCSERHRLASATI
jgi:hypothetical protein